MRPRSKRWPGAATCTCPPRGYASAERQAAAVEVPLAELTWKVRLPDGYGDRPSEGTLVPDNLPQPQLAVANVAAVAYLLTGGVHAFYGDMGCTPGCSESKSAPKSAFHRAGG